MYAIRSYYEAQCIAIPSPGVLACLYGALLLIGSRLGGESVLDPIPLAANSFAGQPA